MNLIGWKFEKIHKPPFHYILVTAPNGYSAHLSQYGMNPENVFYMLAEALLEPDPVSDMSVPDGCQLRQDL